jgi:Ca-activated chloride channel family protein
MPSNINNSAVGAEAEIKEKTKYKPSYTLVFEEQIDKKEKRQLTMEFKVMYSELVSKYLEKFESLRVKFNAQGKVVTVEKMENGTWVIDENIRLEFANIALKSVHKEMTLTLKK